MTVMIEGYEKRDKNPLIQYESTVCKIVSSILDVNLSDFSINSFDYYKVNKDDRLDFPISFNKNINTDKVRFVFEHSSSDLSNEDQTIKNMAAYYDLVQKHSNFRTSKFQKKRIYTVYLNKDIDSNTFWNIAPIKAKKVLFDDYVVADSRSYFTSEVDTLVKQIEREVLNKFSLEIDFNASKEEFTDKINLLAILFV